MFYTLTTASNFEVKAKGFIYHFNYKDVHYYEDGVIVPLGLQPTGLEPFYPATVDATELLNEYRAWCKEFKQEENAQLVSELEDVSYYKAIKAQGLDRAAAKFEDNLNKDMYFTSSLGFRCNGDRRTRDNLQDLITFFDAQQQGGRIKYRDYDNIDRMLTVDELRLLLGEHAENGQGLYVQKWNKQELLEKAETLDEIAKVSTEFEMMNFKEAPSNFMLDSTPLAFTYTAPYGAK